MRKGFTLVEIMIVVAILGLLVAIGVPGFLTARNKSRGNVELANLKAISDNVASYSVNENHDLAAAEIINLWPVDPDRADPASYIRKKLLCPITDGAYTIGSNQGSCTVHGLESNVRDTVLG